MSEQLTTPRFLTPKLARDVVRMVLTTDTMMSNIGLQTGHLIILVPSMEIPETEHVLDFWKTHISPHILYEHSVGNKKQWSHEFDEIARSKALQLWQGRNSDGQTDSNAHLLFKNDTPYWGGVKRHGLVVAFSGVQPWFDQMIAGMIADGLKAFGRDAFETSEDKASGVSFLN